MSARRRGRLGRRLAAGTLALAAVGGGVGAYLLTTGDDEPATQALATTRASRTTLTQTVDASFTLVDDDTKKLQAPASGTVTSVSLTQGKAVKALTKLVGINGKPVYGIPSSYPLYRNLAEGDEGQDVRALQRALADAGYDPGDVDGDFGSSTTNALADWQADQGLDETGKLDLASFVSYRPGSTVDEVAVEVGDRVGNGGELATLSKRGLSAQADVSQLDVDDLKVGQEVNLTFDGLSSATTKGEVDDIATTAESSDSSAGTSTVVQYAVTVAVGKLPSGARAGMTGQASVVTAKRSNVVVVPSSAINGSGSNTTVQVVSDGATVTRRVIVGLVTTQGTEILTGVKAGEEIVTGATSSGSGATNQTQQQGGGFPGGGGGGFPGGGFPGGGGGNP